MFMKTLGMTPEAPTGTSRNNPVSTHGRLDKTGGNQGPRMGTILMVAEAIREGKEYPSKYQLWRSLPKGMAYGKLDEVLKYLESTNQIMIDKDRAIIWILADNPKLKKLLAGTKSF